MWGPERPRRRRFPKGGPPPGGHTRPPHAWGHASFSCSLSKLLLFMRCLMLFFCLWFVCLFVLRLGTRKCSLCFHSRSHRWITSRSFKAVRMGILWRCQPVQLIVLLNIMCGTIYIVDFKWWCESTYVWTYAILETTHTYTPVHLHTHIPAYYHADCLHSSIDHDQL